MFRNIFNHERQNTNVLTIRHYWKKLEKTSFQRNNPCKWIRGQCFLRPYSQNKLQTRRHFSGLMEEKLILKFSWKLTCSWVMKLLLIKRKAYGCHYKHYKTIVFIVVWHAHKRHTAVLWATNPQKNQQPTKKNHTCDISKIEKVTAYSLLIKEVIKSIINRINIWRI